MTLIRNFSIFGRVSGNEAEVTASGELKVFQTGVATSANQALGLTALANLLTELQNKADLSETQPVSVQNFPAIQAVSQSGAWSTGRTWTLSSGTDSVTEANSSAIAASLSVLDDWDESDRAKVNLIVGQSGISAGAGAVAANTPRVVIATDQSAIPVTQSGTWTTARSWALASGTDSVTAVQGTSPWITSLDAASLAALELIGIKGADGSTIAGNANPLPISDAGGSITVDGTVSIGNFPATQAVTQSTSPWVTNDPGLPDTLGQKTSANSTSVVIASDQSSLPVSVTPASNGSTSGTISVVDSVYGTSSDPTGASPTANSFVTLALPAGTSSTEIQLSGTLVGTVQFETSVDGVNFNKRVYRSTGVLNNLQTTALSFPSEWRGNSAGMTHVRVRCISRTSGTLTVALTSTTGVGAIFLNAAIPIGGQSTLNNSTANISGTSAFTGVFENMENVATIGIDISLNRNYSVQYQWSQDGTTVFETTTAVSVLSGVVYYRELKPKAQYFRIVVNNLEAGTASQVNIEVLYRAVATGGPSTQLGVTSQITDNLLMPAIQGISIIKSAANTYAPAMSVGTTGQALNAIRVGNQSEDAVHGSGDVGTFMLGVANEAQTTFVSNDGDYSPIATNMKGHVYMIPGPPVTSNISSASAVAAGTLITVPANKIWRGTVTVSASITAALNAAAANGNARITWTPGTGGTAAYTVAQVMLSTPVVGLTSLVGISSSDSIVTMDIELYAGTTSGTLALAQTNMTQFFGAVSGKIIN